MKHIIVFPNNKELEFFENVKKYFKDLEKEDGYKKTEIEDSYVIETDYSRICRISFLQGNIRWRGDIQWYSEDTHYLNKYFVKIWGSISKKFSEELRKDNGNKYKAVSGTHYNTTYKFDSLEEATKFISIFIEDVTTHLNIRE